MAKKRSPDPEHTEEGDDDEASSSHSEYNLGEDEHWLSEASILRTLDSHTLKSKRTAHAMIAEVLASALVKQFVNWQDDITKTKFEHFHGVVIPHLERTPDGGIPRFYAPFDLPWMPRGFGMNQLFPTMTHLADYDIPFGMDIVEKDNTRYPYICVGYNKQSETWTFVTRKPKRKNITYAYIKTNDLKTFTDISLLRVWTFMYEEWLHDKYVS